MQQLSRTCQVADHSFKAIEYVCVYPQCQVSRFLCSKCILGFNHKHSQSDNSHILDNRDFYEKIKNKLNQAQGKLQFQKYDIEKSIVPLKQLIQEIQNLLKNIQNIIQQVEQGELQNNNTIYLEYQLLNIQKYGFNQIDDELLNNLINIPEQVQEIDIQQQVEDKANSIIKNTLKIKEWRLQQVENNQQLSQLQKIKVAKYQIQQIDDTGQKSIYTGAISNGLKYVISGVEDKSLKIWDYQSKKLIQQILLKNSIYSCRFTEDSKFLYAGSLKYIYQFDVNNQFKESYKQEIHEGQINCIYCITNKILLTSSSDKTIIKTDVDKKQQLLKIQAHNDYIYGLDYNKSLYIIVSGSDDKSIKLWNGNDGSLIIEKLNAHNNDRYIRQVLFIINNYQLVSLDVVNNIIIWNIIYETKQLEKQQLIGNSGSNISLVLQKQYIIATGKKFIKVYSINGEFVRQFDNEIDHVWNFNTTQIDSMKEILIQGTYKLYVCQIDMD